MMTLFGDPALWLPFAFAVLMGVSILVYVVLDGFDLGVGLLTPFADEAEKDRMIASIGPFWDANETWLVLAVGLLLVAFPAAHGEILGALYLPVAAMLTGVVLRGVAFEFRAKAPLPQKGLWNRAFFAGSLLTAAAQGYMLGRYILGFDDTPAAIAFALLTAACLTAGYGFIGATWLLLKTEGALQARAAAWGRRCLWGVAAGFVAVSIATPLASPRLFDKWFAWPEMLALAPLPLVAGGLLVWLWRDLRRDRAALERAGWRPFARAAGLFACAFIGLAYSFYPYVVPGAMTIYEAAAAPESLLIIFVGAVFILPVISAYSALAYYVFRGKATELRYD